MITALAPFVQQALEAAGVVLGISGAAAMALQRYRAASLCWVVSNLALIVLALSTGLGMLALMYCVYGVLAVVSLVNLNRADRQKAQASSQREIPAEVNPRAAEPRELPRSGTPTREAEPLRVSAPERSASAATPVA